MSEYCEWPREHILFVNDEHADVGTALCNNTVANIKEDGYIHFMVLFTLQRLDNINHAYQFIMPIQVRKLEESFLVKIRDGGEEFMLNTHDMGELQRFFVYIFELMKSRFDTPFLDLTTRDFLQNH